tara:strand:- start:5977 stop:6672 length:696 start_codon:yes stop_codon:yes gene_type:complete
MPERTFTKSSTLTVMKAYADKVGITYPKGIKKQDMYVLMDKKGMMTKGRGAGSSQSTVKGLRGNKNVAQIQRAKLDIARRKLRDDITGTGSGGTRSGLDAQGKQNFAMYNNTKVGFFNVPMLRGKVMGKAVGEYKIVLPGGTEIPMAKSWRPTWSIVEAQSFGPRNKISWLKKYGPPPSGQVVKPTVVGAARSDDTKKKIGAEVLDRTGKKPVSKEEFAAARRKLMAMMKK